MTTIATVAQTDGCDELADYEEEYENSQMFSPRFRQYAEELSDQLIATYDLHHKHIVEIGGGKGDFLRIICDRGNNVGVSFGPSYKPEPGDDTPTKRLIPLLPVRSTFCS